MMNSGIVLVAMILLTALLYFEKTDRLKGKLLTKTPLSSLFIAAAVLQPHPIPSYYRIMLTGFVLCLGGDVLLAIPGQKSFRGGLISFLMGHLFYTLGFISITGVHFRSLAATAGLMIVGFSIFRWLRPGLGNMKIPVIAYITVISAMLMGAFTVAGDTSLSVSGRFSIVAGAGLFYLSDIFVARNRFLNESFSNRLMGLPLYYAGQFTLAFSVGLFQPLP
jgi:uncharacterized membrane protein YhhN